MSSVEAVVFKNRDGYRLFGTLHTPERVSPDCPTIVLLSPGIKMRVGPHRLYNRITAMLNGLGFTVFKFDFLGLGDSEGELNHELLHEVYNDTETGRFVNDGLDALNWLEENRGSSEFIVGGLCGGAITGLLLAKDDLRVRGLISLAMTVTLSVGAQSHSKFASQGELVALRRGYLRKLVDPKSWFRLLTFQTDFSALAKSILQVFRKKNQTLPSAGTSEAALRVPNSNANPLFPPAFFSMMESQRKILMVYSSTDRTYWDFEEKFVQEYAQQLKTGAGSYVMRLIKEANHVFSFRIWEQEMLEIVAAWLTENFCTHDTKQK